MKEYNTVIGIDLGDQTSRYAMMVRDEDEIQDEGNVRTTEAAFRRRFSGVEPSLVAIEAGTHSPWISRLLEECGHCVVVANPRKLRAIYTNDLKSDHVDAQMLARIARVDPHLLAPIQHRGKDAQKDRAVLQARDALVRMRSMVINQVRGITKSFGERLSDCDGACFHKKVRDEIPKPLQGALYPLLRQIGNITKEISGMDKMIAKMCVKSYPETQLLQSIQGVGPITSLAFVLTLEDPQRFSSSRMVGPFLGLTPRRDQSGQRDPQLRITKAGNKFMRQLLVGSAQYILGPLNKQDSELRQFGLRLAGPKNDKGKHDQKLKKKAVIAVARKLGVLLHNLWVTGQFYDPFFQKTLREERKGAIQ